MMDKRKLCCKCGTTDGTKILALLVNPPWYRCLVCGTEWDEWGKVRPEKGPDNEA